MSSRELRIRQLRQERPRRHFLSASLGVLAVLTVYSWLSGEFYGGEAFSARRIDNAVRFFGEIRPYPTRGEPLTLSALADWASGLLEGGGIDAFMVTLAMSVAAIVLAGAAALVVCVPAARTLMTPEPYLPSVRRVSPALRAGARAVVVATRFGLVFVRAVPEYVWAFLLIKMLGFGAWPAVLALAIHNTGILGKLTAETIENIEPSRAGSLRGLGAGRLQIAAFAVAPDVFSRFLLYFFYRWETCVREATVLGMLGIVSLGSLVRDARAANFYDEMVFYVAMGAAAVLLGDMVSALARAVVRRSA